MTDSLQPKLAFRRNEICNNCFQTNVTQSLDNGAVLEFDNVAYKLEIQITDYNETNTDAEPNKVKTVKSIVTYKIGGEEKQVELSTVIT